jgi:putative polyhydroxyalkanoate system protein
MADIDYQQAHTLGLEKARELALRWMNEGAQQLGLNCHHLTGETQDTITFERMGVKGTMVVSGSNFDLKVKLGMMMAAFKPMIEAELARNMAKLAAQTGTSSDQA